jgi:hypothetical protein
MTEQLEHAQFLENLNSSFRLPVEGGEPFELRLIEVSELNRGPRQEMFSVVFCCCSDRILPQRIYGLEHDAMGQFEIFLVPISKSDQGVNYEAVFNRVIENSKSSGAVS